MSPDELDGNALNALILNVERKFTCSLGEPLSFLEFNRNRYIYEMISISALIEDKSLDEYTTALIQAMESAFGSLENAGAVSLIWRLGQRITMDISHSCRAGGNLIRIRTRLIALDGKDEQVRSPFRLLEEAPLFLTKEMIEDEVYWPTTRPRKSQPGDVQITCGCEAGKHCPNGNVVNRPCVIRLDELSLLRITNDVIQARFKSARDREEKGNG